MKSKKNIVAFEKVNSRRKIRINTPLAGHLVGAVIAIKVDENNTPLDRYWRDRVKDSTIDGCVEFVEKA